MQTSICYTIIIPVYNEEAVVSETYRRLTQVMRPLGEPYEMLFVNDGSTDRTADIITKLAESDQSVKLLDFSRNFGHQIAITAGMDHARGAAIVIIDADLQDPPELIPRMIEKWHEGYEVVYAKRLKRQNETVFKLWTAALFYRTLRALAQVNIPLDTGDFRLMDRKVCDAMRRLREKNRFVRGLVSWVGFRQTAIEYVRDQRFAGQTKYPFKKMLSFALDGIISFSDKPLKLATYLGAPITLTSLFGLVVSSIYCVLGRAGIGWVLFTCLMSLNGVIITLLGIMGEYVRRIYDEAKDRPLYILRGGEKVTGMSLKRGKQAC